VSRSVGSADPPLSAYRIRTPSMTRKSVSGCVVVADMSRILRPRAIVRTREFPSEVPGLLTRHGFTVIDLTSPTGAASAGRQAAAECRDEALGQGQPGELTGAKRRVTRDGSS